MNGEQKLSLLRKEIASRGYDGYILQHNDQHNSEYLAEPDERIHFISGFSGSNGIGLVTQSIALMWTDGRYFIQIEKELYPGWQMMKMTRHDCSLADHIKLTLPKHSKIGLDMSLFSSNDVDTLSMKLADYELIDDKDNIIDSIWGKDKPVYKKEKVLVLPECYTGQSVKAKYDVLRKSLITRVKKWTQTQEGALLSSSITSFKYLISKLDDIAWLLNLRGCDIPYNPVFFAYAIFTCTNNPEMKIDLFADEDKFNTDDIIAHLKENNITLHKYQEIETALKQPLPPNTLFIIDSDSSNKRMYDLCITSNKHQTYEIEEDLIEIIKGVKNETELNGYRNANIRDCVALVKFFSWMETQLITQHRTDLTEYEIGLQNKAFREQQDKFKGESFAPICAAGSNAAIIHYEQTATNHSTMSLDKLILCDTGGQYLDGTTDITRTVHYACPKDKEKEFYTRVLLGNLMLERCVFKQGSTLRSLDAIPRSFLYAVGKDYEHGTSHGVGHFLNVHEGPYGLPLKKGNVITNEPGYYEKDAFGIRIENMLVVVDKSEYGENKLGFENITYVPYERNLIDLSLMSADMIKYVDDYHKKCYEILSPFMKDDVVALEYLTKKTKPLQQQ